MQIMFRSIILAILILFPSITNAAVKPKPSGLDQHYQTIDYKPDQVVQLNVSTGYSLTIALSSGEQIDNIAIGDPNSWQVTPNKRGDHLFISLLNPGNSSTNLTVITNLRTYLFLLSASYGSEYDLPFLVTFNYEDTENSTQQNMLNQTDISPAKGYRLSGSKALRPSYIGDDGLKTYIYFGSNQDIPAIYAIDANNSERLLDGKMRNGQYVIDSINKRLLFRLGNDTASAARIEIKRRGD